MPKKKDTRNLEVCFILGIMPRSGTNFLLRLLTLHPACVDPGRIGEDFFVHNSDLLVRYVNEIYKIWRSWTAKKDILPPDVLLSYFGDALTRFLNFQFACKSTKAAGSDQGYSPSGQARFLVVKTPSVRCLLNFFRIFPAAHLVILIRDGRAVVESGVRSFDWDYEKAMKDWAIAARTITQFKANMQNTNHKFLIVKYEDLCSNMKGELCRIFQFLCLESEVYDFDGAKSLSITGSSETWRKGKTDKINWKPAEKTSDFNPLARFSHWNKKKHERFNWIAGDSLSVLGYCAKTRGTKQYLYSMWNTLLDLTWHVRVALRHPTKVMRRTKREVERVRKLMRQSY